MPAQGITMDQADIYGGYAEEILGNALKARACGAVGVTKCDIVAPAGRHAQTR